MLIILNLNSRYMSVYFIFLICLKIFLNNKMGFLDLNIDCVIYK